MAVVQLDCGGFCAHAMVQIDADDSIGRERLFRYCARPIFASERLDWQKTGEQLCYRLTKPGPEGRSEVFLSPAEFLDRIAALVPPPRRHRHRYFGVLAPNSPWRETVTARAGLPIEAEVHTKPFKPATAPTELDQAPHPARAPPIEAAEINQSIPDAWLEPPSITENAGFLCPTERKNKAVCVINGLHGTSWVSALLTGVGLATRLRRKRALNFLSFQRITLVSSTRSRPASE